MVQAQEAGQAAPAPVNEKANLLRSQADEAYQRGDYKRVIDIANQLLQMYPKDNPHVAYHLRASAKIELGKAARDGKQIRDGIADSRSALKEGEGKFPWLNVPYIYGMTALGELENKAEHLETAIKWVTPLTQYKDDARKRPVLWSGPVLAGDRLLIAGTQGDLLAVSPFTGEVLGKMDLRDPTRLAPVIANRTIYVLTDSGRLIALR